jgi:hypothetical protein
MPNQPVIPDGHDRLLILPALASSHVSREMARDHTLYGGSKGFIHNNKPTIGEKHEQQIV